MALIVFKVKQVERICSCQYEIGFSFISAGMGSRSVEGVRKGRNTEIRVRRSWSNLKVVRESWMSVKERNRLDLSTC